MSQCYSREGQSAKFVSRQRPQRAGIFVPRQLQRDLNRGIFVSRQRQWRDLKRGIFVSRQRQRRNLESGIFVTRQRRRREIFLSRIATAKDLNWRGFREILIGDFRPAPGASQRVFDRGFLSRAGGSRRNPNRGFLSRARGAQIVFNPGFLSPPAEKSQRKNSPGVLSCIFSALGKRNRTFVCFIHSNAKSGHREPIHGISIGTSIAKHEVFRWASKLKNFLRLSNTEPIQA